MHLGGRTSLKYARCPSDCRIVCIAGARGAPRCPELDGGNYEAGGSWSLLSAKACSFFEKVLNEVAGENSG